MPTSAVSVCPVRALTFESLDLRLHLWYARTSSEYVAQVRMSRSWGQGQGHRKRDRRA